MPEPREQLEQELLAIWQRAANTRKATSQHRIRHLLRRLRAEVSVHDLLKLVGYLLSTYLQLYGAVLNALFTTIRKPVCTPEKYNHE